ncbi:MAG: ATP-dependent RecD-like DNA helicase [Eubacteriales bacterium]|nr:ATP-dependent RecD-like DNA helicase [Clostridiales bacterium]MDD2441385.1 ATP-dependent RecD-like DNA helicase [Eubacteriales bacterium]MDD4139122.1 ATP-dependent RecD-like DNA helicase [Eubacteriales bacterium]MDD4743971.1 ATP-dependent RecD-like DNA helicase [Eubacteriales bacterium]
MAVPTDSNLNPFGPSERFAEPTAIEQAILEGLVYTIVFRNDQNGYTVLVLDHDNGPTVVGTLPFLSAGENVRFFGRWTEHPDYGSQFTASHYELMAPKTTQAIEQYLASGLIQGVGKALARRLTRAFGTETLDILREQPDEAARIKGISLEKAHHIAGQLREKKEFQDLVLLLSPLGIGSGKALRIYRTLGSDAIRLISENPYRLADEVFGIGFLTADRLARNLGLDLQSPARLGSALKFVLTQAAYNGHTYLPETVLLEQAGALLQTDLADPEAILRQCCEQHQMVRSGRIFGDPSDGRVALSSLFYTENMAARRLIQLLQSSPARCRHLCDPRLADAVISDSCARHDLVLAPEQQDALRQALKEPVMILTGGPGTGKTTILRLLCDCLEAHGGHVLLAAPTGRAAKRLGEATGRPAKTLHRLLNLQVSSDDGDQALAYRAEASKKLSADLVVVDEASMIDVFLLRSLLEAVEPGNRLLLVGDADQLPSVGPGDVLRNLIDCGRVPAARLTQVFRQSAQSLIIRNAHRIHDGLWPELDQSKDSQFLFIPKENADSVAQAVIRLVQEILPQQYGLDPLRDVFVLTPSRKGNAGTLSLNQVLQQVLLPSADKRAGMRSHGRYFGLGDKVMQTRNNYDLAWHTSGDESQDGNGVFNGETGTVVDVDDASDSLQVQFDDDRLVVYDRASLEDLELAYALTVHKSQGSEYPVVILAVAPGSPQLLSRNLLYTAVTRARQKLLLISSRRVIGRMLANVEAQQRYSFLKDYLAHGTGEPVP